jgi:hypothetical protein
MLSVFWESCWEVFWFLEALFGLFDVRVPCRNMDFIADLFLNEFQEFPEQFCESFPGVSRRRYCQDGVVPAVSFDIDWYWFVSPWLLRLILCCAYFIFVPFVRSVICPYLYLFLFLFVTVRCFFFGGFFVRVGFDLGADSY